MRMCIRGTANLFDKNHLLHINETATGASNSCLYSDIAINVIRLIILIMSVDQLIEQQANNLK